MATESTDSGLYTTADDQSLSRVTSSFTMLENSTIDNGLEFSTTAAAFITNLNNSSNSLLQTSQTAAYNDGSTTVFAFSNTTRHAQYPNSTSVLICTDEESRCLAMLQEETTVAMIPAMTYLVILAIVGLVGNSLVLFVYSRKFTQTPTRIFIVAIASFDIVTNVVAIPGEIYDMFHLWDFNQPMVCKTRLFFNAFTTMVAAMVLVAVAVVRYRKICKPFKKQVSIRHARIVSVTLTLAALIFSIPYSIINGRQTKTTKYDNIRGYECTIDDSYKNTIWPTINGAFFIFLFIACSIPLVVMYILIGVTAWRHSRVYGVVLYSKDKHQQQTSDSSNSYGASTKSTEDAPLKITTSPKTRSFVKKKGENSEEVQSPSWLKENHSNTECLNSHEQDHHHSNADDNCRDDKGDNVIKCKSDAANCKQYTGNFQGNNNCSIRTILSHTGEKVQVNMSMVRELTVKLRAVKKEADKRTSDNSSHSYDIRKEDEEEAENFPGKVAQDTNIKNTQTNNDTVCKNENSCPVMEEGIRLSVVMKLKNRSVENNLCNEMDKLSVLNKHKRLSKSLGDLTRLTDRSNLSKELAKLKSAEHEDLDTRADKRSLQEYKEVAENGDEDNAEPLSDFAKAMQWVDLTYCLQDDNKDDENTKHDTNSEEIDGNSLSKKGSFALGRKISRDNSFLQRHKKLKDALTDTLTRARRRMKEREAAEDDANENHGFGVLENINSESDNTCTNEDVDSADNGKDRKNTIVSINYENKSCKRKASKVNEDLTISEPGKKSKVENHGAKRRGLGRTTFMLILISAVYILGFLPYLSLMFVKHSSPATFENMELASLALYNLFLRSYFLNSAANPIIYSLCDINFRRECFGLLKCS